MISFLQKPTSGQESTHEEEETTVFNETKLEWDYLRKKCKNLELEQFYEDYMHRLRVSYLSLFICIQAIVLIVHCILLTTTVLRVDDVYMDIIVYILSAIIVWVILSVNYRSELVKRYSWIGYVTSWIAITILVFSDIAIPVYHATTDHDILRPTYGSFILYSTYIFMPLPDNMNALMLGMAVTFSYLINYAFITYRRNAGGTQRLDWNKLASEAIFLISINLLGMYFRLMKEIAIRTTFIDRRQCVEENLLLRFARDQEKSLLLSIIPARIANKIEQDVKVRIEHLKMADQIKLSLLGIASKPQQTPTIKRWRSPSPEKLFIEPHNDVTILYADVVNYTYLTTTLDVKTLVETLHDLFVRFDTASEDNNVLRIKFLGDCYYCVAGVPIPNEQHARCCVELGLQMIKDIREVRNKRKLNIDMRIGVHSGNILSGVIGACKWQFDIWSKDVDIASRLEQTGMAGRVHVSEQTLKLLDGEYLYEEGTPVARSDEVLRKYRIRSFLIKPPKILSYTDLTRPSSGVRRQIEQRMKHDAANNFMPDTLMQYNQIRTQAKLEMSRELDKMPIARIQLRKLCFGQHKRLTQDEMEEQSFRSNITSICLFFKDWRWEFLFMNEPDLLLKYSVFLGAVIFLAILFMQIINDNEQPEYFYHMIAADICVLGLFLFLVWYKKLWVMFSKDSETSSKPLNRFSSVMFTISDIVQRNVIARIVIYLLIVVMHCTCTLLQIVRCDRYELDNNEIELELFEEVEIPITCFNPWAITESLMLAMCMSFLFSRIPFVLKLSVSFIIITIYIVIVAFEYDYVYEKSPSTNVGLYPECSHLLVLLITLGIFHLMDRQTEFISKVDYNWKRQLQKKQDDAKITNETIKVLINNILPSHVADIYMSKKMKNELYFEEYDNVAVMFATIRNYDTEKVGLRVLNEIICDFDEVLNQYLGPLKIEKIKVAGWSYMAACGLDLARSEHVTPQVSYRNSSLLPNGRRSHYNRSTRNNRESVVVDVPESDGPSTSKDAKNSRLTSQRYQGHSSSSSLSSSSPSRNRKISTGNGNSVVYVMAQFALDLMRTMHNFNMENLQSDDADADPGMLRIGISNGAIMAGVVGSSKPHYDIWGNAVNMASRMDSTGINGRIQVTEETAHILESFNIRCKYRGQTQVKGRGEIPTFLIDVDKNLNFVKIDEASVTPNTSISRMST